jgi:hypothetical protein
MTKRTSKLICDSGPVPKSKLSPLSKLKQDSIVPRHLWNDSSPPTFAGTPVKQDPRGETCRLVVLTRVASNATMTFVTSGRLFA